MVVDLAELVQRLLVARLRVNSLNDTDGAFYGWVGEGTGPQPQQTCWSPGLVGSRQAELRRTIFELQVLIADPSLKPGKPRRARTSADGSCANGRSK